MGSIAGTVLGAVENVTRTCKAYLYNGSINLYPASSIMQKIKPYTAVASVVGAFAIDYVAGKAITYGQNMLYRKFG